MRLKEIKPGMVIHCKTQEEADMLCEALGAEDKWKKYWNDNKDKTCYQISNNDFFCYGSISSFVRKITEFSDLILPEMTAAEALQYAVEICNETVCSNCPMKSCCFKDVKSDKEKTFEVLENLKSDHEKKEPEMEWVFKGVADIVGCNEIEFFASEESAREWCERRTLETGTNHAYVPVCRVKAAE